MKRKLEAPPSTVRDTEMSLRNVLLLAVLVLFALFTILNWTAFIAPTTLSLVFATVQAPLGVIMLVASGILAALFIAYVAYLQSTVLLEARRSGRELSSQRRLADEAETSRFTELRTFLDARITKLETEFAQSQAAAKGDLEHATADLRVTIEETGTMLSAYIGEAQDRLERANRTSQVVP